ncbi:hypothetical protein IWQ62_005014 [Dispira parvispora]|uniref:Oxysterol-binding protein n=1 Tax=Dispira parvispora TaxID=1520584 RepID=A0A9W8E1F9_9FUNG|nr:hypothetical protein IWQ62_005014 [Dispira parvispora]
MATDTDRPGDDLPVPSNAAQPKVLTKQSDDSGTAPEVVEVNSGAESHDEKSRFSALWGILHKLVGVKDFVSLRLSLPAELLDPIPNLEHWNYMDRPDYFARISDPEDPVDRLLAVAAWWFTRDLKYIDQKIKKPYNSVLGEQFHCHWVVDPTNSGNAGGQPDLSDDPRPTSRSSADPSGSDTAVGGMCDGNDSSDATTDGGLRVEYITEQISHHPPVSAYYYGCPAKGITATGMDHICARFTGTTVKVDPGERGKRMYLCLGQRDNEEYVLTHPAGHVAGFLRGHLTVHMTDYTTIVCSKTGLALETHYKDERWFGKAKHAIEGKIYRYDPKDPKQDSLHTHPVVVPKDRIVATLEGSWRGQVFVRRSNAPKGQQPELLLDLSKLQALPKKVKPLDQQKPVESHRIWKDVTENILNNRFAQATKAKRAIEEQQRHKTAERKKLGVEFTPELFDIDPARPERPVLKQSLSPSTSE